MWSIVKAVKILEYFVWIITFAVPSGIYASAKQILELLWKSDEVGSWPHTSLTVGHHTVYWEMVVAEVIGEGGRGGAGTRRQKP